MSNCPFCNLDPTPNPSAAQTSFSSPRLAKLSVALPQHAAALDSQMPDVRGRLRRAVHRHRHQRHNRSTPPNSNSDFLSDFADISGRSILSPALQRARFFHKYFTSYSSRNRREAGFVIEQPFFSR